MDKELPKDKLSLTPPTAFIRVTESHLPGVGLTIRCLETGESHFYSPHDLPINTGPRLCFTPDYPLTPGEWEATVSTQLSPQRHLYKTLRTDSIIFTVEEVRDTLNASCALPCAHALYRGSRTTPSEATRLPRCRH